MAFEWLPFPLPGNQLGHQPRLEVASFLRIRFQSLGNSWWVQDDGWDAVQQRHLSELHRTMGRFEVHVGDERLLIENQATDIGRAEVDEYLQDFKGDLIWLVLGSGTATAAAPGLPVGGELLPALSDFTAAVARVTAQPARTLREILADTPRSRLRPNAATFRQHARIPTSPRLVGRASEETADTADNLYLRHMLQTCSRLALAAAGAVQQQSTRWADRANFEHERSITYAETRIRTLIAAALAQLEVETGTAIAASVDPATGCAVSRVERWFGTRPTPTPERLMPPRLTGGASVLKRPSRWPCSTACWVLGAGRPNSVRTSTVAA